VPNKLLPFEEIGVSKYTTLGSLQQSLCEHYGHTNTKRARMLINDEIISGLKLKETLDSLKIGTGTLIYIEFMEPNNTWPTENYEMKRLSEESKSDSKKN
jgi:hypothetical protein